MRMVKAKRTVTRAVCVDQECARLSRVHNTRKMCVCVTRTKCSVFTPVACTTFADVCARNVSKKEIRMCQILAKGLMGKRERIYSPLFQPLLIFAILLVVVRAIFLIWIFVDTASGSSCTSWKPCNDIHYFCGCL